MKKQFLDPIIIVIDGDGDWEVISQAFSYRKPYKRALIVERVKALLNRMA